MWSGSEWIPAPPDQGSQQLNMQDSVIGGDVVHNTVVNNDPAAVTTAVIAALQQMGMVNPAPSTPTAPPPAPEVALPAAFNVGDHVEYHSPTNARWLDRCKVVGINDDGTYRIEVPYQDSVVQTKHAVVIGSAPGTIRPASPPFKAGDRVLVDWKRYGHYYPGRIALEHENHTFLIHFDDGDVEDNVEWIRIEPLDEDSVEVQEYVETVMNEEQELIDAFRVFDNDNTGTISAREYLRILSELGDNPLPVDDVLQEFVELGIELDSEIDYRALAKFMVASEQDEPSQQTKQEVVIHDAVIEGDRLSGYAYDHPKLGEGRINSSAIVAVTYDERATARVETQNTVYLFGQPVGKKHHPIIHSTMQTINSTRARALVQPNATVRISPPLSLTAFQATSTETSSFSGGEWVTVTSGGIWQTGTVWTGNEETITALNHRLTLPQARAGQPTTRPKERRPFRLWNAMETHCPTTHSALDRT